MIEYRKANLSDIDELVRMRIEFLKEIGADIANKDDNALQQELNKYFNDKMPCGEFVAWLAIENDKIVATSGLCFYTLPPSFKNPSGNVAYIMNMYTIPNYRSKGIAKVLFENIVNEAKERNYKHISLHATEQGRPLYLKFGFKESHGEMILKI